MENNIMIKIPRDGGDTFELLLKPQGNSCFEVYSNTSSNLLFVVYSLCDLLENLTVMTWSEGTVSDPYKIRVSYLFNYIQYNEMYWNKDSNNDIVLYAGNGKVRLGAFPSIELFAIFFNGLVADYFSKKEFMDKKVPSFDKNVSTLDKRIQSGYNYKGSMNSSIRCLQSGSFIEIYTDYNEKVATVKTAVELVQVIKDLEDDKYA